MKRKAKEKTLVSGDHMNRYTFALVVLVIVAGCHRARVAQSPDPPHQGPNPDSLRQGPARRETPPRVQDSSVVAFFQDTGASQGASGAPTHAFRTPARADSLLAVLARQRRLWRAAGMTDYRFLLRVGCFCPGTRGWLLMDVRGGSLVRAWDRTGRSLAITDWNTFSIEGLFDHLERFADQPANVEITFDPRWHFPARVSTARVPGPDAWATYEARAPTRIPVNTN